MNNKSIHKKFDLTGKIIIITGGCGLLGLKHAEAVAEYGAIPVLLDLNKEIGNEKANYISHEYNVRCDFNRCNITDEKQVNRVKEIVVEKYGRIDVLINNAALDPKVANDTNINLSRLENFPLRQWNLEIAVGLSGAMLCSKVFGTEMAKNNQGVILNISSDLGVIAPDQRLYEVDGLSPNEQPVKPVTYSVIKHGLVGLTKYLATYWAKNNIRVNSVCPTFVDTPKVCEKN